MITPAQQKRIDDKLARQEQTRQEEKNQRLAEEKLKSEETQRQQAIVNFIGKCYYDMRDFQFSHHSIQRMMEFNDFGDGYGELYFSCDDKPVVGFADMKRMSEFLGTENINIKTNCVLISMDDEDSYKKVYTLCVEVGYI